MLSNKRLFVIDPVCALKFGHNLTLLRWYLVNYQGTFGVTRGAVARDLPEDADPERSLLRVFTFLYHAEIPLPGSFWATPRGRKLRRIWLRESRAFRRFLSRKLAIPVVVDPLARRARADWRGFWRKHAIGPDDVLLLPGTDYYAARALLKLLDKLPSAAAPRIHLRFMNVMENATGAGGIDLIARDALAYGRVGDRLTLSAETETYARYLSARFQYPVAVTAHPLEARRTKKLGSGFTVACLGSGRADKGFGRLADIIACHAGLAASSPVRFVVQSMNPGSRDYSSFAHARLSSLPHVELLPHSITAEEMIRRYAEADLCLLPYCPDTYAMRGSAVVPEAIASGCLVVASDATAFSPIVAACGGRLATDTKDFAEAIRDLSALSPESRHAMADKAYETYRDIFAASMRGLDASLGL